MTTRKKLKIEEVTLPEVPVVKDTPEGWPCYCTEDGKTWYQKAMNYQRRTGNRPVPLEYAYDEDNNLISVDPVEHKKMEMPEMPEDILVNGGIFIWPTKEENDGSSK